MYMVYKIKMCHLVKFHRKHLYACCDSERKNKREADIWERKSVTLKYQKFGSNRTESFGVPLHILEHSLVWGGGGRARDCGLTLFRVNTCG